MLISKKKNYTLFVSLVSLLRDSPFLASSNSISSCRMNISRLCSLQSTIQRKTTCSSRYHKINLYLMLEMNTTIINLIQIYPEYQRLSQPHLRKSFRGYAGGDLGKSLSVSRKSMQLQFSSSFSSSEERAQDKKSAGAQKNFIRSQRLSRKKERNEEVLAKGTCQIH